LKGFEYAETIKYNSNKKYVKKEDFTCQ
jgi:hypothetical protein